MMQSHRMAAEDSANRLAKMQSPANVSGDKSHGTSPCPMDQMDGTKSPTAQDCIHDLVLRRFDEFAFITTAAGKIGYVTSNAPRVLGAQYGEELVGMKLQSLFGELPRPGYASIVPMPPDPHGETSGLVSVVCESIDSLRGSLIYRCVKQVSRPIEIHPTERRDDPTHTYQIRFQRLFEDLTAEYFFFRVGLDGTVEYVSPSVESILGYRSTSMIGMNWRDFVDVSRAVNRPLEELERHRMQGQSRLNHHFELEVSHRDGSMRLLELRDVPAFDEQGVTVASEGICHDITNRRKAEMMLKKAHDEIAKHAKERVAELDCVNELYKSVLEHQSEFIVQWLPNGNRTFVNPAYSEYVGLSGKELIGKPLSRLDQPSARAETLAMIERLNPDSPISMTEVTQVKTDGSEVLQRWVDHGIFDGSGQLVMIQSVGRDVTRERRELESFSQLAEFRELCRSLTPRERQVMDLVSEGKPNKDIAIELKLSVKTVEKHRSSMMRKLQVQSVADLVRRVVESQLPGH